MYNPNEQIKTPLPIDLTMDKTLINKFGAYLPETYMNLHRLKRERILIDTIGRYHVEKINEKIDFEDVKRKCVEKLKNTPPNLDAIGAQKYIKKVNKTLETYGKLKFCVRDLDIGEYGIESVYFLYIIYLKLSKQSFKNINRTKEFMFLLQMVGKTHINIFSVPKYPLHMLSSILFEQLAGDNFEFDPDAIYDEVEQENFYQLLKECDITPEELETKRDEFMHIIITEKYFEHWLENEIQTINNWNLR